MIWTQWNDLDIPSSATHLPTDGVGPDERDLSKITFYVPCYMGGKEALRIIPRMTSLKVVQSPNAGIDDILEVLPSGVTLCNAAGVHNVSTAELAVGLAIAVRRGLAQYARDQVHETWAHRSNKSLADSRVGIVGYGNIGKLIGKQLENFSVEVIPFTRDGRLGTFPMSEMDALLPTLDILILILPLTSSTHHLINKERLAMLKDGATLINVARGPIVDTEALIIELESGRLYAGLDVTDPEPLPKGHPLWSAPNLIITPHVGGDSTAFEPRGRKLVEDQIHRWVNGDELINVVSGLKRPNFF
jgi:phosphoglycerate dehydrogenase-like enzyme